MTVVTNKHELAADTHVDTAKEHDGSGHYAPQQQEEESPLGLIIDNNTGVVVLVVVAVKYGPAGVFSSVPSISAVSVSYVIRIGKFSV